MEYKSPGGYVSIGDFYKVYGYACFYAALEKVPVTEITLSFVESRHPRELLRHFRDVRGWDAAEKSPGIYSVKGDILAIQVIDSRKLPEDENLWLRELGNRVRPEALGRIAEAVWKGGAA